MTQGMDRDVVEIEEDAGTFQRVLPGARGFIVVSEGLTCDHEPRCRWYDRVIVYEGRCVVLSTRDMICTSLATTLRRLTGNNEEVQELAVECVEEVEFDSLN